MEAERADRLLLRLVERLRRDGSLTKPDVITAFRAVPRHLFVPEATVEDAYQDEVIVTKRSAGGETLSSASQPSIVALMLQQLDVRPGHRVLEIGAGTGYNAALLASIVGPDGQVTTVDIDADIADRAATALAGAGFDRVRVYCRDGGSGAAEHAPYDRIIVTAGAWDLPPAWIEQLTPTGVLVLPLSIRGVDVSVAFGRTVSPPDLSRASHPQPLLRSRSVIGCGFLPLRGDFAGTWQRVELREGSGVVLSVGDGRELDLPTLTELLGSVQGPEVRRVGGVVASSWRLSAGLDLWLASADRAIGWLHLTPEAVRNRLTPAPLVFDNGIGRHAALVTGESLAVVTYGESGPANADDHDTALQLGVAGYGPHGGELADRLAELLGVWVAGPAMTGIDPVTVEAYPAGTPDSALPPGSAVVDKPHARLTLAW